MSSNAWEKYCNTTASCYTRRYGWEDKPSITAGRAKEILAAAKADGLSGNSKINPALTKQAVFDILSAVVGDDDEIPLRYLHAKNIVREFMAQARRIANADS